MTRSIAAAALLAATIIFAPAAKACISCNYTPEVVNTPSPNVKPKRVEKAPRQPSAAKKQRPPSVAKAPKPAKKQQPTESATDDSKAKTEPKAETEPEAETAKASSGPSGTSALIGIESANVPSNAADDETAKAVETKPDQGCKKYVPALGADVTVPCE